VFSGSGGVSEPAVGPRRNEFSGCAREIGTAATEQGEIDFAGRKNEATGLDVAV